MTITPIVPADGRLDGDLAAAQQAVARAQQSADCAAAGATAYTRVSITVFTPEEVAAFARTWGTVAEWRAGETQYVAEAIGGAAALEAIWHRPTAASTNGVAA